MRRFMRRLFIGAFFVLAGCVANVPTNPDAFDVRPEQLSQLRRGQAVALANGYPGEAKASLRVFSENTRMNVGTWVIDQGQLTNTAIAMLTRALEKHAIQTRDQAEKTVTLRLRPLDARMWRPPFSPIVEWRAIMALEASFGDGSGSSIQVENKTPMGGQRAFDGAVQFALEGLLKDEKFVAYMNR